MKKILTIINYIIKVIFAFIGVVAIIGFFSNNSSTWYSKYIDSLEKKIDFLKKEIDTTEDIKKQAIDTYRLVELLKKKKYIKEWIDRINGYEFLLDILSEKGLDGAIEYLKVDSNFKESIKISVTPNVRSFRWLHRAILDDLSKGERFYILHELYEFKSIIDNDKDSKIKSKIYLEKSIEIEPSDWGFYQYAKLLVQEDNFLAIKYFKDAIEISDDKEFIKKIKLNLAKALAKFKKIEEAKKIYQELISTKYKNQVLIELVLISKRDEIESYFNQIDSKFNDLDEETRYIEAIEKMATIYLHNKEYSKSKELFEKALEFYYDNSTSNPNMFENIARINKKLIFVYKGLGFSGSQKESIKKAIFYYKRLNMVFKKKYNSELELLYKLQKELGE